jgi:hypothetical protein
MQNARGGQRSDDLLSLGGGFFFCLCYHQFKFIVVFGNVHLPVLHYPSLRLPSESILFKGINSQYGELIP